MFRFLILTLLFLSACSSLPIRMADRSNPDTPTPVDSQSEVLKDGSQRSRKLSDYNIAVIIGPGAMNTVSAAGVLKYLHEKEANIKFVVGLGFGSLVGAFYANNKKPHEVDWQFFKLKDIDLRTKNFFGSYKNKLDISKLTDSLEKVFAEKKIENFKLPFACSDPSLTRGAYRLKLSGRATKAIVSCIEMLPVKSEGEAMVSFGHTLDFLEEKSINFVIYIDSLSNIPGKALRSLSLKDRINWRQVMELNQQYAELANFTFQIPSEDLSLFSFSQAKDRISLGKKTAEEQFGLLLNSLRQ